jgi:hypothetical protein
MARERLKSLLAENPVGAAQFLSERYNMDAGFKLTPIEDHAARMKTSRLAITTEKYKTLKWRRKNTYRKRLPPNC